MVRMLSILLIVVVASSCDDPRCPETACPLAQICIDGTCVVAGGPTNGGPGGTGPGDDTGPPAFIQVSGPISMFQPGSLGPLGRLAGQPAGTALLGMYEPGGRDQVLFFDVATGKLPEQPGLGQGVDFIAGDTVVLGDGCNLDHASAERGYRPDGGDEVWLSCNGRGLFRARADDDDFKNQVERLPGTEGADHVLAFGADPVDPQTLQRRLFARRGTSTLYIERAEQGQQAGIPRRRDTIAGAVTFGAIAGLFKVTEMNPAATLGDLVIVFDRASPLAGGKPALVPLQRPFTGTITQWVLAPSPWRVVTLPDATHAVRIGAIPDKLQLQIDANDANIVNLTVFLPTEGRVIFGRLERTMTERNGLLTPGDFGFQDLLLNRTNIPSTVPPATDRILLVDSPDGDNTVFYMMTNELVGWKLPLHGTIEDNRSNDVRGTVINGATGVAVGMIPLTADAAWVAYAGDTNSDVILQVRFTL